MNVVADVNAGGIGVHHFQAQIFARHFPHHFPPLLAVHLSPLARFAAHNGFLSSILAFLGFLRCFAHAVLLVLNSTWLGPGGETCTISPAGSGPCSLFRTSLPPSSQSLRPEPCFLSGRYAPEKLRP